MTGYIKKPFSSDQLKKKLLLDQRLLDYRRSSGNEVAWG